MGRQRWGTKDHVVLVWSHVFVCVHICEYLCVPDRTAPETARGSCMHESVRM